jgi:hypothetical protein
MESSSCVVLTLRLTLDNSSLIEEKLGRNPLLSPRESNNNLSNLYFFMLEFTCCFSVCPFRLEWSEKKYVQFTNCF